MNWVQHRGAVGQLKLVPLTSHSGVPIQVLAVLLIQIYDNAPGKREEGGPCSPVWETLMMFLLHGFGLAQTWLLWPFKEWLNRWNISLSPLPLSVALSNEYVCLFSHLFIKLELSWRCSKQLRLVYVLGACVVYWVKLLPAVLASPVNVILSPSCCTSYLVLC